MKGNMSKSTETLRKDFGKILPAESILAEATDLLAYRNDASWFTGNPGIVVLPCSTEEVQKCMKYAYEKEIAIVPRGSGTGLSGGTVPAEGAIIIDLSRMNKILELDKDNLTVRVQPGVITAEINRVVEKEGLFYPPDPASQGASTIGGNIACRAGGPRGVKYGTTKDYVLGLEAVVPPGNVIRYGGKVIKLSVGYEIGRLFVGSEGTLGIITEATLKLIPRPMYKKTMLISYGELAKASETVSRLVADKIIPTTLELMDNVTVRAIEEFKKAGYPTEADGLLLIECDGYKEQDVEEQIEIVINACKSLGATDIKIAENDEQAEQIWAGRRSMFAAYANSAPTVISEDVTVPRTKVPDIVRAIKEISAKYGIRVGIGGHVGDGNMHPNYMVDKRNADEMERVEKACAEVAKTALAMGGVVSGEHGVGLAKARYAMWQLGDLYVDYMKAVKKVFDPKNLLNPGKLWIENGGEEK
ncbi:MAG: FAD-binding oxidoreductase [Peptococcaceae bacterium]